MSLFGLVLIVSFMAGVLLAILENQKKSRLEGGGNPSLIGVRRTIYPLKGGLQTRQGRGIMPT